MPKFLEVTDTVAARAALAVPAAAGNTSTDAATITAAIAAENDVLLQAGDYEVSSAGVTVSAGKRLTVGTGASIKLADDQITGGSGSAFPLRLSDGSSFVGLVDANRDGQDKAGFNANPGVAIRGIVATGTESVPLTDLYVDATVINAATYPLFFTYVNDSYVKVRAQDCGGAVAFTNCHNLTVDIEVDRCDNDGWMVWQHAVDFTECSNINGRVIVRDQSGTGRPGSNTGNSEWNSGLTILNSSDLTFSEVDCYFTSEPNQSRGVGLSMLGVRRINISRLRISGYSDTLVEVGGVVDSTFYGLDLDGRYISAQNTGQGMGINLYNNLAGGSPDMNSRSLEHSRNVKFVGGSIRRCLGLGLNIKASTDIAWHGISITGCQVGAATVAVDQSATEGPSPTADGNIPTRHRFIDCEFSYNERSGVAATDLTDSVFESCRANNNSQAATYGETRGGLTPDLSTAGFQTKTSSNDKSGLVWMGECNADDTQGSSAPGFPDPARPLVLAVDRAERYAPGQTITVAGAGAAAANLLTRVNEITRDELTLQHPIETFPLVTLTGTIATSGTTITGSGTAFTTELVGRAWIKVGSEYRQLSKVASDTSATLRTAFTSDAAAGTALVIVRATITAAHSQRYGFNFSADTIAPVVSGNTPTGNTAGQVNDLSTGLSRTLTAPVIAGATLLAETGGRGVVQTSGPDTDHGIEVKSKGAGAVQLRNTAASPPMLQVQSTGSGADTTWFQMTGTASGGVPSLQALGTDTNIGLSLAPKGDESVRVYMSAGETTATLEATGVESAVDLDLVSKSTGLVRANGQPVVTDDDGRLFASKLLAPITYTSGQYYFCNSAGATSTGGTTNNTVRVTAWLVTESITVSRLFAETTVAGESGCVFRFGIWSDDDGKPGSLVVDAGTAAADGVGPFEVTLSQALNPGIYWVGGAVQSAPSTQPTLRTVNSTTLPAALPLGSTLPTNNAVGTFIQGSVTGAFSTFSATPSISTLAARIGFKVA